jgi:hypothetical protein
MKRINIDGKEYTLEYTIEASLYNECIEKVTTLFAKVSMSDGTENGTLSIIKSMSDVPRTTLSMFYAGLLEHHGPEGDGSIQSTDDAKRLVKKYFAEHKDEDTGNFYGLMNELLSIMADDDFFAQIGLTQIAEKQQKVQPQDHKRKATEVSVNGR